MDDKTLLEMAARAAGIKAVYTPMLYLNGLSIIDDETGRHTDWNPLQDDGDALRLAVKLRMDVKQWNSLAIATKAWNKHAEENTSTQCPYAATRRAIVRAAAAIGSAHEAQ